ncbi:MAG: Arc family DNA-binding protein [Proteobacteria bacterium]|nr:Arc family DNA-binding protein [Pseudomonadota bacterium]
MNITIRNIPEEVISKLRALPQIERRSLNNEILNALMDGMKWEAE